MTLVYGAKIKKRDDVLDLATHSKSQEDQKVDDKNRPVHWDIENFRGRAKQSNYAGTRGRKPLLYINMRGLCGPQQTHQNCHSGRRRTKGRNSSSLWEGKGLASASPPPSISSARRSS